jgi:hypothetical protein
MYVCKPRSRDSDGLRDEGSGFGFPAGAKIFLSPQCPDALESTHPSIQWIPGGLFCRE